MKKTLHWEWMAGGRMTLKEMIKRGVESDPNTIKDREWMARRWGIYRGCGRKEPKPL
jgi:hypothetical protein